MLKRMFIVVLAGVGLAITLAVPAQAHDMSFTGPYGCGLALWTECGYGAFTGQHTWVAACDTRADGRGYSVEYQLANGATGTVGDGNGSKSGCGGQYVTTQANRVVRVRGIAGPFMTGWQTA